VPETARTLLRVRTPSHWLSRYALTCGIVVVATLLRAAADPLIHDQIPYFIYVASVVVTTWFCGLGAGLLGTVLAAFGGNYFFVPPRYQLIPQREDWNAMVVFSVVAFGLVWLVNRWRRAEHALQLHADRLRQQSDDLRALHAESERVSRLKDEFLATLSHELRTPLNAVLGWAQLLDAGQLDARQQRRATETIVRNAKAQARLVEDILDVSAIVNGKLRLRLTTVDLAAVVRSAIEVVRPAAEAKRIEMRTLFAPHLLMVGDADRLRQVAWNLLSNAVKFSNPSAVVNVRIDHDASQLVLTVADAGKGIDPEFLPYLFERFRQADSSTTREWGGLGLGLAIVRHMVELHGGTVSAESGGVNHGATFRVMLPVRAVLADSSSPSSGQLAVAEGDAVEAPVSLDGIRVLVVDDEADALALVEAVLAKFGADVRVATTAEDAFHEVRIWRPDVLVADVAMPVEDGYSLLRRIRALAPDEGGTIPAAALTAYAQADDRDRAFAAGFQEHVSKPVMPHQLARLVATLASRSPGIPERVH
jgi:signal transduction histidine kinase/ActR/RegA family two-component response regulator